MRPAFFATSVPLPMAMPMSAALMAGASLTPSPVIATTSPFFLSVLASSTLCSGATRPTTPMASIRASCSSSPMAAKSAPRIASPGMPSCRAIAAPVVTSSPVTMRTRMCPAWAPATAALASSRGGSTMPTRLVIRSSVTYASRSPSGSKPAGSRSRVAAAITRRPSPPIRSVCASARAASSSSHGTVAPAASAPVARATTAGTAPLTKHRTT